MYSYGMSDYSQHIHTVLNNKKKINKIKSEVTITVIGTG